MKRVIDVESWKRREEYLFFRGFFNPMVSVTVEVDCTEAYRRAKEEGFPFSLYYMHAAVTAANHVEEFRYRQEGEEVVLYDHLDLLTPIQTGDGSYRSVILEADEEWESFLHKARPVVEAARRGEGQAHGENEHGRGVLLISVNPWYRFTSVQQAIPKEPHQNIPIFTFGKMEERDGRLTMPLAMSVNHGFVSGYEIGRYLEEAERKLKAIG